MIEYQCAWLQMGVWEQTFGEIHFVAIATFDNILPTICLPSPCVDLMIFHWTIHALQGKQYARCVGLLFNLITNTSCLVISCQYIKDSNKKSTAYLVQVYLFFLNKSIPLSHSRILLWKECYDSNVE